MTKKAIEELKEEKTEDIKKEKESRGNPEIREAPSVIKQLAGKVLKSVEDSETKDEDKEVKEKIKEKIKDGLEVVTEKEVMKQSTDIA